MILPSDPRQLVIDLIPRSICSVRVAAVVVDGWGIFGWSWNGVGDGFGEHAEAACIRRSNKRRLRGSTIYVAAVRMRSTRPCTVTARPCRACEMLLRAYGIDRIVYRNKEGIWVSHTS